MYQEMRRYRDYELTVATWYTTILLAVLGFVLSGLSGGLITFVIALFAKDLNFSISTEEK